MYGIQATLSQGIIDHLRKDVDLHLEKYPAHKFLDNIRITCVGALNAELSPRGYPPFEYAMLFRFIDGVKQQIHIDGVNVDNLRRATLNVLTHGEKATFEWFSMGADIYREENYKIKSFKFDPNGEKTLLEAWDVPQVHLATTDVPHRFIAHEPVNLVCLRFKTNPSFDELRTK